jgi:hypothetical protein
MGQVCVFEIRITGFRRVYIEWTFLSIILRKQFSFVDDQVFYIFFFFMKWNEVTV